MVTVTWSFLCSLWSPSLVSVQCSLWSLSLEVFCAAYGHCHLKFSVFLMVTLTWSVLCFFWSPSFLSVQCFLRSLPLEIFCAPYGHCQSEVFCAPYNMANCSTSRHYLYWHVCRPVNIYIMLCNVPLSAVRCNAADLLMILPLMSNCQHCNIIPTDTCSISL